MFQNLMVEKTGMSKILVTSTWYHTEECQHSQQFYHSCLLWFKINTVTIRLTSGTGLIQQSRTVFQPQTTRQGRQAPSTSQPKKLHTRHNIHWSMQHKRIWCCVCSTKNKQRRIKFQCRECNIGLCDSPCFELYYTKLHF
jgi:hypothetical protein